MTEPIQCAAPIKYLLKIGETFRTFAPLLVDTERNTENDFEKIMKSEMKNNQREKITFFCALFLIAGAVTLFGQTRPARPKTIAPKPTPIKTIAAQNSGKTIVPPPKSEWLKDSAARPVNVSANPDRAKSVTQTITTDGGFIAAIGADGTEYTLKIPKNALLSDEEITMTPLTGVSNLPIEKGFVAGVQLEPEGLRLLQLATLTIETKEEIPADQQVSFAYFNKGDDAHLYPISLDPHKVEFKLFHFSGYGFGRKGSGDSANVNILKNSKNAEARLSSRIAEAIQRERERILRENGDEKLSDETIELLYQTAVEYYDDVVRPLMRVAESNDKMASCALLSYLGWQREIQILGLNAGLTGSAAVLKKREQEAQTSASKILDNLYEKSQQRALEMCRQHDFSFVSYLLGIERMAQMLGFATGKNFAATFDKLNKCMVFEVEFDSIVENKAADVNFYYHVKSKFEYDLSQKNPPVAPLEYVKYVASGDLGSLMGNDNSLGGGLIKAGVSGPLSAEGTKPGNFILYKIGWNMNLKQVEGTSCGGEAEKQKKEVAEKFYIIFAPGKPTEIYGHVNNLTNEKTSSETRSWAYHWEQSHKREIYNPFEESERSYIKIISANQDKKAKMRRLSDELLALQFGDKLKPTEKKSGGDEESDEEDYDKTDYDGEGEEKPTIFRIALEPVGKSANPGTWRTDFNKPGDNSFGIILSENGYILVRHTPKL